jgi:hypothetical protein
MVRRLALIAIIILPVLAIVLDAYPLYAEPLVLIFAVPLFLSAVCIYLMSGNPPRPVIRQRLLVALVSAVILPSVLFTHWPLRLTFALAKPKLTRSEKYFSTYLGQQGDIEFTHVNLRFGLIPVQRMVRSQERYGHTRGFTGFWLDPEPGPNTSSGFRGFVYSETGEYPGNLWTDIDLGEGWRFVIED